MVRVGLCLPQLGDHVTGRSFTHFCRRAEELGYSSLWAQEHLFFPLQPKSGYAGVPGLPVPEQYRTVLAATEAMAHAAAVTSRATVGASILVAGYHRPVELAQRIATLDVLSGGRTVLGLSVGWSIDEHEQMSVDHRRRGRRADELVRALLACWGPDPVHFDGEWFSIPESVVRPKPVQQPHPPLLSGMWSEAGLRRTAELFDIWNPARGTPEEVSAIVDRLNEARAGRPPLRLYFRSFAQKPTPRPGDPVAGVGGVVDDVKACARAGVEEVIVDCNFWTAMDSPEAWAAAPDLLVPALEAAAG